MPVEFVCVGGTPLMVRAVRTMFGSGAVDRVILAVPKEVLGTARVFFDAEPERIDVVSFYRDSDFWPLSPDVHTIVVHDARRPLVPPALVTAVVDAAAIEGAVIVPALPVSDTIKQVGTDGAVLGTVDRSVLRVMQTPVAMPAAVLRDAGPLTFTSGVGLVEQLDGAVLTVPGDPLAFEINTPWDLELAELLLVAP